MWSPWIAMKSYYVAQGKSTAGNELPSDSSVFCCWQEDEGNRWDCKDKRERGPVISVSSNRQSDDENGTDSNFSIILESWEALFLLIVGIIFVWLLMFIVNRKYFSMFQVACIAWPMLLGTAFSISRLIAIETMCL